MTTLNELTVKVAADFTRYVLVIGTMEVHRAKAALPYTVESYESVTAGKFMRIDGHWSQFGTGEPGETHVVGSVPGVMFHKPVRK